MGKTKTTVLSLLYPGTSTPGHDSEFVTDEMSEVENDVNIKSNTGTRVTKQNDGISISEVSEGDFWNSDEESSFLQLSSLST